MYVFPLLYILFNTILPDLFILLILGVKRYLVLNCLSLVTAYHIYLPSVKCLYNWGKFFHWIVCLCLLNFWNPWYILKLNSLLIICVANIFVTCLYYTLLFFFFLDEQKFSILMPTGPSFLSWLALFPCLCCLASRPPISGRKLTGTKPALGSGYTSLDSHFHT